MSTVTTTMDEHRGTPLEELEPLLLELGALAGCVGSFTPSLTLQPDGFTIKVDGPDAHIVVVTRLKGDAS